MKISGPDPEVFTACVGSPPASMTIAESDGVDGGIETSCGRCRGTNAFVVSMGTNSSF